MIMPYLKSKCNIHTYNDIYKQGKESKKVRILLSEKASKPTHLVLFAMLH